MSLDTDYIVIGKVGTTYGVLGWMKIVSFTDTVADILNYDPWYLEENKTWKRMKLDGTPRMHGKGIVAKFAGFDSPETARVLTGKKIAIQRTQLAKLNQNEYYWSDLEGLTVINQDGKVFGKIIYIMETGSNDVLVVKGDKEHAIPYLLGDVVTSVDLVNKVMHVVWEEI
jgi:16S rRNA processing protein RimM